MCIRRMDTSATETRLTLISLNLKILCQLDVMSVTLLPRSQEDVFLGRSRSSVVGSLSLRGLYSWTLAHATWHTFVLLFSCSVPVPSASRGGGICEEESLLEIFG